MRPSATPLATIALPLFRSRPFRDCIAANFERLDDPRFEIIVSDRHQDDETLAWLAQRFAADPRFIFLAGHDRLNWVEHFNLLLARARGQYFQWMAHDDEFPAGYVARLVEALERTPGAIVAFGEVRPQLEPGHATPAARWLTPPRHTHPPRRSRGALALLGDGNLALAFHGVIRRTPVVERGLFIRATRDCVNADYYWMFALALLAPFKHVTSVGYLKRYHHNSTHARARISAATMISGAAAMLGYAWQCWGASPRTARVGAAACAWLAHQLSALLRRRQRQWRHHMRQRAAAAARLDDRPPPGPHC